MIDADGYISIMSRSDDLINTAGHRLSTGKFYSDHKRTCRSRKVTDPTNRSD